MRIVDIKTFMLSCPLQKPTLDATAQWDSWNGVLVEVFTDEGLVGIGDIGPLHGRESPIFKTIIETKLKRLLVGENPLDVYRLWDKMLGKGTEAFALGSSGAIVSAISAVDVALWDIAAKIMKTPIYNMLGGLYRRTIPVYASGCFASAAAKPEELVEESYGYVKEGFRAMKMKIGFDAKKDLANIKIVREAIGPDIQLMVDANQGYDLPTAIRMARDMQKYDITWFEEPISIFDIHGMTKLARTTNIPIALGENTYTRYGFKDLVSKRIADIVQPDCKNAGGLTELHRIANIAEIWGVPCAPHIHSPIGFLASLHLLASAPNGLIAEYIAGGASCAIMNELFEDPVNVRNGIAEIPNKPGLGVKIDESVVKRYSEEDR